MPPNCLTRRPGSARLYSWPAQPEIDLERRLRSVGAKAEGASRWPQTRRPFTIVGEMRMKWPPHPGTHDVSATRSRRPISSASDTAPRLPDDGHAPAGVPVLSSTASASNATTAPRVAAASFPSALVLITMSPSTSAKLTSSTAGSACREYTIRPTATEAISRMHSSGDRFSSAGLSVSMTSRMPAADPSREGTRSQNGGLLPRPAHGTPTRCRCGPRPVPGYRAPVGTGTFAPDVRRAASVPSKVKKQVSTGRRAAMKSTVKDVMSTHVIAVRQDAPYKDMAAMLRRGTGQRVPRARRPQQGHRDRLRV